MHAFHRFFLPLALAAYVAGMAMNLLAGLKLGHLRFFLEWKSTQYLVNYLEHGLTRRGLVGTILLPALHGLTSSPTYVHALILAIDAALFITLAWLFARWLTTLELQGQPKGLLVALVVMSPMGAMQFGFDAGRLDHFCYILLAAALKTAYDGRALTAGCWLLASALTHEASLVYGAPLVVTCYLQSSKSSTLATAAKLAAPAVLAVAIAQIFGNHNPVFGAHIHAELTRGTQAWQREVWEPNLSMPMFDMLTLACYLVAPYLLQLSYYRANNLKIDSQFCATCTPLLLFALGIDYARWTHVIFMVCFANILIQMRRGNTSLPKSPVATLTFGTLCLPLGPVGITGFLPYIGRLTGS